MVHSGEPAPKGSALLTERRSESRHVRKFTGHEILMILLEAVKREAGHQDAAVTGASIRLVSPQDLSPITVKVEVTEVHP